MPAPNLVDLGGGRFALSGDLVFETVPALLIPGDAAFAAIARADVDLAGVGRVDSAGLALLLEWSVAARAAGRELGYRQAPAALVTLAGISEVEGLLGTSAGG
jgi:phospholipid transport system transporter-binding protein